MMKRLGQCSVVFVIALLVTAFATSCQPRRQPLPVGGASAELKVTINNMSAEDSAKPELVYELSSCLDTVTGNAATAGEGKVVTFKASGIKKDQICELRIKNPNANTNEIKFLKDSEPGVFYFATDVKIRLDQDGKFTADANVQKLYVTLIPDPTHAFTITVQATFPAPDGTNPLTATLHCDEKIPNVGSFVKEDGANGKFEFLVAIKPEETKKPYNCTTLMVHAGGVSWKYRGDFAEGQGKFVASPGDKILIPEKDRLVLRTQAEPGEKPIDVITEDGGLCDPNTHVFDYVTKECKPKS